MYSFISYADFEQFYQRLTPLTPYGKDEANRRCFYTSAEELRPLWDDTEIMRDYLRDMDRDIAALKRLSYHLKRLPRLPQLSANQAESSPCDEVEIFQFKKFLFNFQATLRLLPHNVLEHFGLAFQDEELLHRLSLGVQSQEAFYITDEYDQELAGLRREIRQTDETLKAEAQKNDDLVQSSLGVSFGNSAFLIMQRRDYSLALEKSAASPAPDSAGLPWECEPYDEEHVLLRPRAGARALALRQQRLSLHSRELAAENRVLRQLTQAISARMQPINSYSLAICRLDMAMARATLANTYALTRPRLQSQEVTGFKVEGGRFIPIEELCRRHSSRYTPLNAHLTCSATVIFGSNMGGKTVVLKTLAFLQLCTQMGLFVPAQRFETRLYGHLHFIGEGHKSEHEEEQQGLSGFGFEIYRLLQALKDCGETTLLLFDEFARTTASREAEALISALLKDIKDQPQLCALFSTHFKGLKRFDNVSYKRMKGLNTEALRAAGFRSPERTSGQASSHTIQSCPQDGAISTDSLKAINSCMDYVLEEETSRDDSRPSDALTIAALLGLPPHLTQAAREYYRP